MRYNLHLILLCFATKYSIFFVTGGQLFVPQGQPVRTAWKDSDTQSPNFEGWCPSKFFKEDTTAKRLTMLSSRSSSPLRCGRQWIYHGRGSPCLSSFQLPSSSYYGRCAHPRPARERPARPLPPASARPPAPTRPPAVSWWADGGPAVAQEFTSISSTDSHNF
jgi:hypothetical protein